MKLCGTSQIRVSKYEIEHPKLSTLAQMCVLCESNVPTAHSRNEKLLEIVYKYEICARREHLHHYL